MSAARTCAGTCWASASRRAPNTLRTRAAAARPLTWPVSTEPVGATVQAMTGGPGGVQDRGQLADGLPLPARSLTLADPRAGHQATTVPAALNQPAASSARRASSTVR